VLIQFSTTTTTTTLAATTLSPSAGSAPRACAHSAPFVCFLFLKDDVERLRYVNTPNARKFRELSAIEELLFCPLGDFSYIFMLLLFLP